MSGGSGGSYKRRPGFTFHGEASHINLHTLDATAYALSEFAPRVKVSQVPCPYCGAEPGETCMRWIRNRRGKHRGPRQDSHPDRKHAAKLANEALDALNPR